MTRVRVPWGAWYGDGWLDLDLPDRWRVTVPAPAGAPALSDEDLRAAFARPIGTPPLRALAASKGAPVIVVDDLTRPTPTARLLPLVLEELRAGGIPADAVRVLVGLGGHRPLARSELLHKLGPLADDLAVINHTPHENLVSFGTTSAGTPIRISRWYAEADLRVTIGCVEPHPALGFSGGAKLVFPGLAGLDAIAANHRPNHLTRGILAPEANAMRLDVEEAVRRVGLDAIANVVVTGRRAVAGLFVGDFVAAHRAAAAFAERIYATPVAGPADVAIFNAYPKDTELLQVNNALNAALAARATILRDDGVVVVTTAASEGPGFHALYNPGARLYERPPHRFLAGRRVLVFCPHGRSGDLPPSIPPGTVCHRDWAEVVRGVERLVGGEPEATVFAEGPLQVPIPAAAAVGAESRLAGTPV